MRISFYLLVFILAACQTTTPTILSSSDEFQSCFAIGAEFREQIDSASATNAGYPAVDFAPFLHSTRFYDSLAHEVSNDLQAQELLSAMARLGDSIRRSENNNMRNPESAERLNELSQCSFTIANGVDQVASRRALINQLQDSPAIDDSYIPAAQWVGFLPLLRPIFEWRIEKLHREEKALFTATEQFLRSNSYMLEDESVSQTDREVFERAYQASPLGIPMLGEDDLLTLFKQHAPRITVEQIGSQDLLGAPTIINGIATIDTDEVTAQFLSSYTRFAGENLLQLNYVFWFPSREPRNWIDLYSGKIDSLIWRVTLDREGKVLLYDSIHSCGCYHKYFIANDSVAVLENSLSAEPANIFDLTTLDHQTGLHLVVSSNEHYIVGVDNETVSEAATYRLTPYASLYNLPTAEGVDSFFDDTGIIAGSERFERLTLWPTGIENVGAMRQWGTHATGFVANQHFDDANLFDKYFTISF